MSAALPVLQYDPRLDGALCSECPLGGRRSAIGLDPSGWKPVRSELKAGAQFLAVGEAPGAEEVKWNQPFIGASGGELERGLGAHHVFRQQYALANVIACRPGDNDNDLDKLLYRVGAYNRRLKKLASPGEIPNYLKHPADCCRPRLLKEARQFQNVLLLGKLAAESFLGPVSISSVRGGPRGVALLSDGSATVGVPFDFKDVPATAIHVWRALPALHPAAVLRRRIERVAFRIDLGRALRFFSGRLDWKRPQMIYRPDPATLAAFLFSGRARYVSDIETKPPPFFRDWKQTGKRKSLAYDPHHAELGLIGTGDREVVVVTPFLSVENHEKRFYTPAEQEAIFGAYRRFYTDPRIVKTGWNFYGYDLPVLMNVLGLDDWPSAWPGYTLAQVPMLPGLTDCVFLSRLADNESPHSLAYRASLVTDSPSWKEDETGVNAQSDMQWAVYNADDVSNNDRTADPLIEATVARRQEQILPYDAVTGALCVGMHRNGVGRVDHVRRRRWERELREQQRHWTDVFRQLSGKDYDPDEGEEEGLNPNSHKQVRELFFSDWGLTPIEFSEKTGEPSTSDEVLIKLYVSPEVSKSQRMVIRALRKTRKATKLFSTYCTPLRPWDQPERKKSGQVWGAVWPDGRLRARFSGHTPASGRTSSGEPVNAQNFPRNAPFNMRSMITADPGHVYVSADLDQVELRIAVGLAQAKRYIEMFRNKVDPHGAMAVWAFAERFTKANGYKEGKKPEKGTVADRLRDLVKRVVYGSLFLAKEDTLHEQITQAEDERGELIYADAELRETKLVYRKWLEFAPEIPQWWQATIDFYRRNGFVFEPILGRRRDCKEHGEDEEELNANTIVNHPVQGANASWMRLAGEKILKRFPFGFDGPNTGVVLEAHDNYMIECKVEHAVEVERELKEMMSGEHPAIPNVKITADAGTQFRWGEEHCPACGGNVDEVMEAFGEEVCRCDEGKRRLEED